MKLGTKSQILDRKKLVDMLTILGQEVKQEKSQEYRSGYMDGLMDFFNETNKIIDTK